MRYRSYSYTSLEALESGGAGVGEIGAEVDLLPKQSTYLKFLFGLDLEYNVPTRGDVGLASTHILGP